MFSTLLVYLKILIEISNFCKVEYSWLIVVFTVFSITNNIYLEHKSFISHLKPSRQSWVIYIPINSLRSLPVSGVSSFFVAICSAIFDKVQDRYQVYAINIYIYIYIFFFLVHNLVCFEPLKSLCTLISYDNFNKIIHSIDSEVYGIRYRSLNCKSFLRCIYFINFWNCENQGVCFIEKKTVTLQNHTSSERYYSLTRFSILAIMRSSRISYKINTVTSLFL